MKKLILLLSAIAFAGVITAQTEVAPSPEAPEAPAVPAAPGKAFLGVVTSTVSRTTAAQLGMTPGVGLTVESVVKGSAADTFGIQKYDILLKMDDQLLTNVSQFTTLLLMKEPGDKTDFTVLRKGAEVVLEVELGSKGARGKTSFDIETKMEAFGERMAELAEKHELLQYVNDPEKLETTIRSALDKARYHIETIGEDDSTRTSIINASGVKTIVSSDDGTLIVEKTEDDKSKVTALDASDEIAFKGLVSDDGHELDDADPWIKDRFLKLKKNVVKISISTTTDADSDVESEWNDEND